MIGRETELASLSELLQPGPAQARLVTLVGPGGVGKTSLALAAATALAPQFEGGAAFVDLAQVSEPRLVPSDDCPCPRGARIGGTERARSAAFRSAGDAGAPAPGQLRASDRRGAVIHRPAGGVPARGTAGQQRAVRRLGTERRFPVEPLATPPDASEAPSVQAIADSPAARLFVERTRMVRPEFAVTPENAVAVATVCRRLEGIPLAIELAAARLEFLDPEALARRLERRLPMLTGGARDRPARHQTLRAALAWSHNLLGPSEQVLFRRLSVFFRQLQRRASTRCVPTAAPADRILEVLQVLSDSSFRSSAARTAPSRRASTMLETIREYAAEMLALSAEAETLRCRHHDWCLAWLEQVHLELSGPRHAAASRAIDRARQSSRCPRLRSRVDPVRAESELRLAAALGQLLEPWRPASEGRVWLSEALARGPATPSAARTTALTLVGLEVGASTVVPS